MSAAPGHLRSFVQRIERLDGEIADLNADKKEVYAEAKGTGFDVKTMRLLIAERRKEPREVAEQSELLDLYRAAMGGTDVATPAPARKSPLRPAQTEVVTPHNPLTGEVIETAGEIPATESCGGVDGHAEMSMPIRSQADNASLVAEGSEGHDAATVGIEPGPQDITTQAVAPESIDSTHAEGGDHDPARVIPAPESQKAIDTPAQSHVGAVWEVPVQVHRTLGGEPLEPVDPKVRAVEMPDIPDFLKRATTQQVGTA